MLQIDDLEEFSKTYFLDPDHKELISKANDRFNRLLARNLKRHLSSGKEKVTLEDAMSDDPGKCMEKARYTYLDQVRYGGQTGRIKIDLIDETMEFIS